MKFVLLAALCAVSLAAIEPYDEFYRLWPERQQISDEKFQIGQEYRFYYDGQVLTGIPQTSQQHSGSRIQAMVVLQFNGQHVVMQLNHVRMGKLNRRVAEPRAQLPFELFERVEVVEELKRELQRPIRFAYINGMVSDIMFEAEEQPWAANIKRGVLNMLQVNLKRQNPTETDEMQISNQMMSSRDEQHAFYRVLEKTLEGECEVIYSVQQEPSVRYDQGKPILNVTKSIDFEKCQQRPDIKYNWRFAEKCETCDPKYQEEEKFLKAQTVAKYNISGDRDQFLIESAKIESHYTVVPYNEHSSVVVTYVNQTLRLYKTQQIQQPIASLQQPVASDSEMVYTLDWDVEKEQFYIDGEDEYMQNLPFSQEENKIEMVQKLIERLVEATRGEVSAQAPRYYSKLVSLLRQLQKEQLSEVMEMLDRMDDQQSLNDAFINALALAGTDDAISHIVDKIRQRKLTTYQAANALRQLMQVRVVSKETVDKVDSLCEEPTVREHLSTRQACYLSVGSLVHTLCNRKDKWAMQSQTRPEDMCSRAYKAKFVEKIRSRLERSSDWEDKIILIKALNNAGLDVSVELLQDIIQNELKQFSVLERIEAISALRHLVKQMPHKVQKLLVPLYMNKYERPSVRMAAFHQLLKTNPERSLITLLVKKLQTERNMQVGSFAYSMLRSMANSTNPCYQTLSSNIALALRFSRAIRPGPAYSKYMHMSMHSQRTLKMGADINAYTIMSNQSIIPRVLGWSLNTNSLGFFNQKIAHVGVALKGWEPLLQKFFGPEGEMYEKSWSQILRRSPRDTGRGFVQDIQSVWDQLKTSPREFEETQPLAYIFMSYLGQEIGFIPVSERSISAWLESDYGSIYEMEQSLRDGKPINFNYATLLEESEYKIPTSIGYPLRYRHQLPFVMTVQGQLAAKIDSESRLVEVTPELEMGIAAKSIRKIEIWNPFASSGLKIEANAKVFVPVKGKAMVNVREQSIVRLEMETPDQTRELISLETSPTLFVKPYPETFKVWSENVELQTVLAEEINRVKSYDQKLLPVHAPIQMRLRARYNHVSEKNMAVSFCPMTGLNKLAIYAQPSEQHRVDAIILEGELPQRAGSSEEYGRQSTVEKTLKLLVKERTAGQVVPSAEIMYEVKYVEGGKRIMQNIEATSLRTSPESKICLNTETNYPNQPFKMEEIQGSQIITQIDLKWGQACRDGKILLKARSEQAEWQQSEQSQTEEYQECKYQREMGYKSPISCYEHLKAASQMKKVTVDIEYHNVPVEVKNMTSKFLRWLKYAAYDKTDVADILVRNPQQKIKAIVRFGGQDSQYLNVTLKMPTENVTMTDIRVPVGLVPQNVKTPYHQSLWKQLTGYSELKATCKVRPQYIQTFDANKYQIPLTTCYSVIAKDCSAAKRFVVMARRTSDSSSDMKLKVLTPKNKIVVTKMADRLDVYLNDEQTTVDDAKKMYAHEHEVVIVQKEGPYLKINLREEGLAVYFDGQAINVKVSPMMRSRVCGLCGHYDLESQDEYRLPEHSYDTQRSSDVREFFHRYLIQDGQCNAPSDYTELCRDERCQWQSKWQQTQRHYSSQEMDVPQFEPSFDYPETSQESNEQYRRQPALSRRPRKLNKVLELEDKICFSKRPINVCPSTTVPAEQSTIEIELVCLARSNMEAQDLLQQARQGLINVSRISAMPTQIVKTVQEPRVCRLL